MITLRKSEDRGLADHGWLKSRHTFSFAEYHDPAHMGVGNLRVINEDRIAPGTGFGEHGHRDMEIVSVVLAGALAHRDSMGHSEVLTPGEVQRMSAGTGVRHSEFNASKGVETHFLQIWIEPQKRGIAPSYEQKRFDDTERRGRLKLVASPDGRNGSLTINADATLAIGQFDGPNEQARHDIAPGRRAYVHVVRGAIDVNGTRLAAGDAAHVEQESVVTLERGDDAEVLLFDLR
jgi:redox-sensitive bicupin YhaK (pirin superfamily)